LQDALAKKASPVILQAALAKMGSRAMAKLLVHRNSKEKGFSFEFHSFFYNFS
jgi:hypothetical protein